MQSKIKLHSGLGFMIIFLGLFHWYWRLNRPRSPAIIRNPIWQTAISKFVHHAFYVLFLISPAIGIILSGLVSYQVSVFGLFEISNWIKDSETTASLVNSVHGFSAVLILYLLILHVCAACYHHFIKRNGLIYRMFPGQ